MVAFCINIIKIKLTIIRLEAFMANRIDGTSLFTSMNSGLNNTFSVLSTTFSDGVTLKNLATNDAANALTSNGLNQNFKSYLQTNFNSVDKNKDGKISADEINNYVTNLTRQGMTMEQLIQLGTSSGMSSSLLDTVMSHFNEIDTNKDGKVTNAEIQAYGVNSSVEKQRKEDRTAMLKQMSTFYETSASKNDSSLLDYRYLDEDSEEA